MKEWAPQSVSARIYVSIRSPICLCLSESMNCEHVRFCMHPFNSWDCFLQCSSLPIHKTHWSSKPDILVQELKAGEPNVGLRPLILWVKSLQLWYPPVCGTWLYHISTPCIFLICFLLHIFRYEKIFSLSLQVILIYNFSVNSCKWDVPVGVVDISTFFTIFTPNESQNSSWQLYDMF